MIAKILILYKLQMSKLRGLNKLKLSSFKWFKKGKIDHNFLKVAGGKKKNFDGTDNEKFKIFDKENKRHLTMMTTDKVFDVHLTHEDRTIPQENLIELRYDTMMTYLKGILTVFKKEDLRVTNWNDEIFQEMYLVNLYSPQMIHYFHHIQDGRKLPIKDLNKIKESKYQLKRKGVTQIMLFKKEYFLF